ncbi:hypothetical protein ES708_24962 [subsurface metagenome]
MSLRIAEQFIKQFGEILEHADTQVLPFDIAHVKSLLDSVAPALGAAKKSPKGGNL